MLFTYVPTLDVGSCCFYSKIIFIMSFRIIY